MSLDEDLMIACTGIEYGALSLGLGSIASSILEIPTYVPQAHETAWQAIMSVPDGCLHAATAGLCAYLTSVVLKQASYWMQDRRKQPMIEIEIVKDPVMEYLDE